MREDNESKVMSLWTLIKKHLRLELDYAKLTISEKLTIFLSAVSIALIIIIIGSIILLMLAFALVDYLKTVTSPVYAYLIVASIIAIALLVLIIGRKSLIINPISKFVTKLFLK